MLVRLQDLFVGLLVGGIRAIEINEYDSTGIKVLKRIGRIITGLYIWVFRGTPMMVQAMFIYYLGKPVIGWTPITAGLIIIFNQYRRLYG